MKRCIEERSVHGQLNDTDYDALCRKYAVFARVTPRQKQELVKALKRQGLQVAMTGDGVNDLLALREADCSIAVADGSDASRQISQVVLLESDFTHLPQVLMEGRKVIDACIEAYPSFLTIFESDIRKIRGRFLPTALSGAAPFGITVAVMIALFSIVAAIPEAEKQTVMYLLLIMISMAAVIKSCIPFNPLRIFICITMVVGTFGALVILPSLFEVTGVTGQMISYLLIGGVMLLILIFVLELLRQLKGSG